MEVDFKHNDKKKEYTVYVDGVFSFVISEENYFKNKIGNKDSFTKDELEKYQNAEDIIKAKQKALIYLSYKIRSEHEVRLKLTNNGFCENAIENAVEKLKELGYISDCTYAEKYILDSIKNNKKSKRKLEYELKNKGINDVVIKSAIDEAEIDEYGDALYMINKRFGSITNIDSKVENRIVNFLKYRGYNMEIILKIFESIK